MMNKSYQRRHLRAPFKGPVLLTDGIDVFKAPALNISEGGMLLTQIPRLPQNDDIHIMFALPIIPLFKSLDLSKIQPISRDLLKKRIIRISGKISRKVDSRYGLEFPVIDPLTKQYIEEYVTTYSANLIFLQTLIDSCRDNETKIKTHILATILGHDQNGNMLTLKESVSHDFKSLQWL
ncbi:MAG: PilZ domain-containing protein [Bacteriovoracaceae bacterium]